MLRVASFQKPYLDQFRCTVLLGMTSDVSPNGRVCNLHAKHRSVNPSMTASWYEVAETDRQDRQELFTCGSRECLRDIANIPDFPM